MHAYKGNDHHTIRHHHHPHISHGHHSKHHVIGHQHYNKNHDHSDESRSDENYTKKRGGIGVQRHEFNRQPEKSETVPYGSCVVTPNTEIPESRIEGNVVVLQKKFDEGPIYYKINLKGFSVGKDVRSRTHGFHIHEKALSGEGSCNSAGAHFNPLNQTHGSPNSKKRHLGDFGNIKVDRNGNLLEYEVIDHLNSIRDIIGKSFVVHERPDDLGKGGNTESLATGSAGRRLACCTIFMGVDDSIRFNG